MRKPSPLQLTDREIRNFLHNAQLAAVEQVADDDIPAIWEFSQNLLEYIRTESQLSIPSMIAVLTTTAYHLHTGGPTDGISNQAG